jgi:hypothetical protein
VASVTSTVFVMVHAMDHLPSLLRHPFLSLSSSFCITVWTSGLPALDVWHSTYAAYVELVLATVPVLDPAGFIGLSGNGLTQSKIDDFLSEQSL